MAKELPYYKFEVLAYLTGDICLERWELQGIFNHVCAFYWSKDCELSSTVLLKKYKGSEHLIQELIDLDIFKVDGEFLSINFLNEQWASKETQRIVNAINGKKGGRPKKQADLNQSEIENKPNGLFFDNRNDNRNETNIEESIIKEEESIIKEDNLGFSEFEEKKSELIETICTAFGFDGSVNLYANNKRIVFQFVTTQLKSIEDLDHFINQYQNYKLYKKTAAEIEHNFTGYFGTPAMQFSNGAWNSENWGLKLEQYKSNNSNKTKFDKLKDAFNAPNPYSK